MQINKKIILPVNGIAAAKQYVPLIKEISHSIPNQKIIITGSKFHSDILLKELSFNNIKTNISYKEKTSNNSENNITIKLSYNNHSIINNENKKELTFHIDPLKFEERRLLNEEEILKLKESYKIREKEKIIFAGAIHYHELSNVLPAVKNHLYKNKKSKAVIVPYTEGYLDDIARYIDFETNHSLKGNKNCIVIEEQGILDKLYSIADVVLMGNTFGENSYDGQNPLEPAFYGKRILTGTDYHLWNKDAYYGLLESGLLRKINIYDLEKELERKVSEKEIRKMQEKAESFIKSKQGAAKAYASIVKKIAYNRISPSEKEYLSYKRSIDELKEFLNI